MSTVETVKAQLNALLNQANDTTGKTDANLTAAIASLAAGFGQGGSAFNHITTFSTATSGYISVQLFADLGLGLTPTHNAGIFVSRGNTDITSDIGNYMLILFYTESRYICIVSGSYNGGITVAATAPSDREETGIGGRIGVSTVGNVRSGYTIVGKQYNVYEAGISAEFAGRIIDYVEETT